MTRAWTPIAVEFEPGALNIVRTQVLLVAAPHSRSAEEAGGLLCGAIVEFATVSLVRIDRVIPIEPGQSAGETRLSLSKAIAESSGDVMGWYRSERSIKDPSNKDPSNKDSGSDARRSATSDDRTSSAELFPGRQSVFLICFPEEDLSLPGSLYLWTAGADETITGVNLGRQALPAEKPAKPREPVPFPVARVPASAPAVAATAPEVPAPTPASKEKRDPVPAAGSPTRSWNALALLLAVAIVGAGAFFLIRGRPATTRSEGASHAPSAGIAMKVQRIGSELQVSWNPHASEVTRAAGGNLVIAEGARSVTLKLSPQQLETGQFVYRSEAEDIRMEMEIAGPSGTYVESVRVAGGLPGLPAGPEIAATAAPRINAPERNSLPEPDPAPVAAKPAAPVPAPEKRTAETTAAPGVAAPVVTPEREEPRAFVPPPRVATAGNAVAARSDAPPPDAPQLAAPVNALAAGLPELKLPVPNAAQPNASQPKAAPRFEEYIGPRAIRSVQPAFDASANRTIDNAFSQNHEPHEVQVEVTIDEHGRVTKASKGATTGPFAYLFVDAALAAARRWQFEPASLGGRPVPSKMTLKFAFVRNH